MLPEKIYRLIIRWPNGATEEVEPYSREEVAKYLLPELDLEMELKNWKAGYTETCHVGASAERVEYIHFVGDIPEGVSIARPNTEPALNTYRLTLADDTFFEKEYQATDDPEGDALRACREMILHLPKNMDTVEEWGVNFCRLIDGRDSTHDLRGTLDATLPTLGYNLDGLSDDELVSRYDALISHWDEVDAMHLDPHAHAGSRAIHRFAAAMKTRGLREYTAAIILDGEDGEPRETEYKEIWAHNYESAIIKVQDWAAERREATGEPWRLLYLDDVEEMLETTCGYYDQDDDWAGLYCDPPEPTEKNILDGELQDARDILKDMKLERLCGQAIEIMNAPMPDGPDGEQIKSYLCDMNTEIIKRAVFWTLITLCIAWAVVVIGGALTLHAWGGTMPTSALHGMQAFYAATVIVATLGIANKKIKALENWAATWAANLAKRRREELERRARDSEGDALRDCASCKYYKLGAGIAYCDAGTLEAVSTNRACDDWKSREEEG